MPYVRRFELRTSQSADELKAWYIRRYRDARTESDFLRIKFPRIGAAPSYLYVPVSLTERPADLAKLLTDKGANWSPDVTERRKAIEIIAKKLPDQIGTMLSQGGWHGEIFMLGTDPIGCKDQRYILRNEFVPQAKESIGCSGTLAEWQERVARPAAKSRYAMFAIMHGLAAPLFRFAGLDEGAIFHLGGDGSTGKTSALMAGASVAGASELTDWNSSERGMHERAAIMSGLQIVLDDTERQPATAARVAALNTLSHTLTSGRSQTYSRVVKGSLPDLRWDCWALSSGPSTMEHAAQKVGYTRTDGDRVRWIDIPSPAAVSGGIWDLARCDSEEDYARLSEALREAASQFHGEVARKWIRLLQVNQNLCREHIPTAIERFISRNCPDAGSVERRI
ncbi:MAG: DUF927 domain-containing protein, partial [Rhizobiaceae bacterium]|nr:DUF927 domain-containing protein [Rhizobiaceae bacterium]